MEAAILNPNRARPAGLDGATQLIIFELDGREYALPVESVSEVLRMVTLSPAPEAPHWLPGVINLRGGVVSVVDLRTKLGLPPADWTVKTPIIVAECNGTLMGLLADAVVELLTVPMSSVSPPDEQFGGMASSVSGVARVGERIIFIFDLERLFVGASALGF